MRKLYAILVAVLLTATVWAQAPQKMSYQAVIRNSSDKLVANTLIGMEINIRQGSTSGTVVYSETQTPTTNANGLVSIEIGGGAGFSTINWGSNTYYIETKTAVVVPLTTYTITGVSQLLSVPYALNAKTAESITGTITETDPVYKSSQAANITANDITKLSNLSGTNTGDQDLTGLATTSAVSTSLNLKVDKEAGTGNVAFTGNIAMNGSQTVKVTLLTANQNYTVDPKDIIILSPPMGANGTITITLPPCKDGNRVIRIKNAGWGTINIQTQQSGVNWDSFETGNPTYTLQGITQVGTPGTSSFHNVPGEEATLISDGNRFWVICQ